MFKIDDADFGIDSKKSHFKLVVSKTGKASIDAEIFGDKTQYDAVTSDEDSPWSCTLYPPKFYIHDFPANTRKLVGLANTKVVRADLDEHEVGLYLMEHNDIDDVTVSVSDSTFQAMGRVFLSGRPHSFSIHFTKATK